MKLTYHTGRHVVYEGQRTGRRGEFALLMQSGIVEALERTSQPYIIEVVNLFAIDDSDGWRHLLHLRHELVLIARAQLLRPGIQVNRLEGVEQGLRVFGGLSCRGVIHHAPGIAHKGRDESRPYDQKRAEISVQHPLRD